MCDVSNAKTIEVLNDVFNRLDEWRKFPNYQLERRADIFFAIYLPTIIEKKFNLDKGSIKPGDVIPEFPIKQKDNRFDQVDYLVICSSSHTVYFVELKTSMSSWDEDQYELLKEIKYPKERFPDGFKSVLNGAFHIIERGRRKKDRDDKRNRVYKEFEKTVSRSKEVRDKYEVLWDRLNCLIPKECEDKNVEIVYIQPDRTKAPEDITVIDFGEVRDFLSDIKGDVIADRFRKSLDEWIPEHSKGAK